MTGREEIIAKLEKEVKRTYAIKTAIYEGGEKVEERIIEHREPFVTITIEIADKILALLKEQDAQIKNRDESLEKAREEIKWLRGMLKEQEAMHWISVKDRLPTYAELKDDCVLVLFDDGDICSTGFDEFIEDESIFGEWRQNFDPVTLGATDSYWMPLEGVTHWMPIPKLMQEGR